MAQCDQFWHSDEDFGCGNGDTGMSEAAVDDTVNIVVFPNEAPDAQFSGMVSIPSSGVS